MLFQHQVAGVEFLSARRRALLAFDMGLGKSACAILAAEKVGARKILVICRAVARANWRNEFEKWGTDAKPIHLCYGAKPEIPEGDDWVLVVSYEGAVGLGRILARDGACLDRRGIFDLVVVDESHFLKEPSAKRTQAILGGKGICSLAPRSWLLTGTPCPNHAGELWTTLFAFGATRLNHEQFVNKFCRTVRTGFGVKILGSKTDPKSLADFKAAMKDAVLRKTLKDTDVKLPPISYETVVVAPGGVLLAEHKEFIKYVLPVDRTAELKEKVAVEYGILNAIVNGQEMSDQMFEMLKAEAQSVSTLRRFTALQKIEPIAQQIRGEIEMGQYDKIVVFATHRCMVEGLRVRLLDLGCAVIYGGSDPGRVETVLSRFQAPISTKKFAKPLRILIGNIQAAGTSLNLTAANQVIFAEQSWTPGENDQAVRRCLRIGQDRPVTVRNFVLDDPLERRVCAVLESKTREISKLLDSDAEAGIEDLF